MSCAVEGLVGEKGGRGVGRAEKGAEKGEIREKGAAKGCGRPAAAAAPGKGRQTTANLGKKPLPPPRQRGPPGHHAGADPLPMASPGVRV